MSAGSRAAASRHRASAPSSSKAKSRANWTEIPPGLWIRSVGGMSALAIRCVVHLLSPGLSWRREFFIQFAVIFRLAVIPIFVINLLIGFTGTGVQGGAVLEAFGAIDRVGAIVPVAFLREGGPLISGAVCAGVVGTTINAEIGARRIREELDALSVLGVDPVRNLVLPRIVALVTNMLVLNMIGFVGGVLGAYVGAVGVLDATTHSFFTQALANTSYIDLWGSEIKAVVFGLMIGIVSCYKGLNVKGGAEGVGRAVNESVVANLVGVGVLGLVFTSLFLALFPDVMVLR